MQSLSVHQYICRAPMKETRMELITTILYTDHNNPNRIILEQSIAQLEQGKHAYAFSSGMAAISAVFQSLKALVWKVTISIQLQPV